MVRPVRRFDVFLVCLDPTIGSEIKKTRPCVIVSPDEMNTAIRTVIIAPLSKTGNVYPTRIPIRFEGRKGLIILDQIRTIDKARLIRKIGTLRPKTRQLVCAVLGKMFQW